MNAFNDVVQAILASGLDPDKAAELIGIFIEYRSLVKSEVRSAEKAADNLRDDILDLRELNGELIDKIAKLGKELAEAKAKEGLAIRFNVSEAFNKSVGMQDHFVDFVRWIRNDAVIFSDGKQLDLYTAKYVAESIFAKYGFRKMDTPPFRGEACGAIEHGDSREEVLTFIKAVLSFNYPGYKLDSLDDTLWSKE